jgi:hypothetical protein
MMQNYRGGMGPCFRQSARKSRLQADTRRRKTQKAEEKVSVVAYSTLRTPRVELESFLFPNFDDDER